ncbi:MAG TPA: hypothetical protein VNZ52_11620 [Candidatus Thermoplasmatota archaeon]|nr:hypothetical protein [Candidatus Thermoplasmatota archaeon]
MLDHVKPWDAVDLVHYIVRRRATFQTFRGNLPFTANLKEDVVSLRNAQGKVRQVPSQEIAMLVKKLHGLDAEGTMKLQKSAPHTAYLLTLLAEATGNVELREALTEAPAAPSTPSAPSSPPPPTGEPQ